MTAESDDVKDRGIDKILGIDYESQEWKDGVLHYNNRVILKHDIESKKFLVVRRLLREGNISVLDKDNQEMLAQFLDAVLEGLPQGKKERGRPQDDEIKSIEFMKELGQEYERLHTNEGITIDATLEALVEVSERLGKRLSKKRIEELCNQYNTFRPHYDSRLEELYNDDNYNLRGQYRVLIGDATYIDYISSLDDCRPIELKPTDLSQENRVPPEVHENAVRTLAAKYKLTAGDIERRLKSEERLWDHHDIQEFQHNPLFDYLK